MTSNIDKVIELDLGCVPEAGSSEALLIQTELSAFLTFGVRYATGDQTDCAGRALVEFPRCIITQFGYPNDEALPGHPLYAFGLKYYGIFEIMNPSWLKRIDQQNRVAFPKFDTYASRHFLITFHDSTFECLAADIHLKIMSDSAYKNSLQSVFDRIIQG